MARVRNRSHAQRSATRSEYALMTGNRRLVINEILFLTLLSAGIIELSRKRQRQGRLKDGWSFQHETIINEHNKLSASHDEWVLRRTLPSGKEISISHESLISFLGVLIRRKQKM